MSFDAEQLLRAPACGLPHARRGVRRAAAGSVRGHGGAAEIVQDNIQQLYDDQFIETCEPWVIPYIGELIGYNSIYEVSAAGGEGRRRGRQHDRLPPPQGDAAGARADVTLTSPDGPRSQSRSSGA